MILSHNRVFSHFFSYMDGRPKVVAGDDTSYFDGSVDTPLHLLHWKIHNDESSCTSAMDNYFVRKMSYGTNHPNQRYHEEQLVMILENVYTP